MATLVNLSLVERYENLPTIVKLREIIRKLWKLEVGFIDDKGFVVDHARGKVVPPMNSFCRGTLYCRKGLTLCDKSVRELNEVLKSGAFPKGCLFDGICHLGFKMAAIPYFVEGRYIGALFSCGFLTEKLSDQNARKLNDKLSEINGGVDDPLLAAREVSVINEAALEYLMELIRFGINEMETFRKEIREREEEIEALNRELKEKYSLGGMIGQTIVMKRLFSMIERVAECDSTVLITGENGSGKELVAKAIHYLSGRKDKRFIAQNCSAFNDNLLDSELFGHVKGSFTGAVREKKGLFEAANGGTFLLDEIGDMSPSLQVKVLRILQEGTFIPVGGTEQRSVDVRIIAATNKDLKSMIGSGLFREDLFYRVNVIHINVPPLRERREDIPLLVEHFIKKSAKKLKRKEVNFSPEVMQALLDYNWPGNIRQLENEVERVSVLAREGEKITVELLSRDIRETFQKENVESDDGSLREAVRKLERRMILDGLKRYNWNKSRLSKELGISRASLIMKVAKYEMAKDCFEA